MLYRTASGILRWHLLKGDDAIEDSEPGELQGKIKDLVELSMRMVDVAKASKDDF